MPTKKHRFMIILDNDTEFMLGVIMKEINTKQRSKAINECIKSLYDILIQLKTL